jgi:uncharacterized membrane protein
VLQHVQLVERLNGESVAGRVLSCRLGANASSTLVLPQLLLLVMALLCCLKFSSANDVVILRATALQPRQPMKKPRTGCFAPSLLLFVFVCIAICLCRSAKQGKCAQIMIVYITLW